MVVDDVGEVVGWISVLLNNDEVIFYGRLLVVSVDEVVDDRLLAAFESYTMRLAVSCPTRGCIRRNVRAGPVVDGLLALLNVYGSHLIQVLGRAEASVGEAFIYQLFRMLVIYL